MRELQFRNSNGPRERNSDVVHHVCQWQVNMDRLYCGKKCAHTGVHVTESTIQYTMQFVTTHSTLFNE